MQRRKPDDALIRPSRPGLAGEDGVAMNANQAAREVRIVAAGAPLGIAPRGGAQGPILVSGTLSAKQRRHGGEEQPAPAVARWAEESNAANDLLPPLLMPADRGAIAFRCDRGAALGVVAHLIAIAIVAVTTTLVFFGIAFVQLRPQAKAVEQQLPPTPSAVVAAVPASTLPGRGIAAKAGPVAAHLSKPMPAPRLDSAAPIPAPGPKLAGLTPKTVTAAATATGVAGVSRRVAGRSPDGRAADDQAAGLVTRGDVFLRAGDIASARLFYERAADGGNGQAALRAGATFDPIFLASIGLRGLRGDPARALDWYHRALALGANNAKPYLQRLENR